MLAPFQTTGRTNRFVTAPESWPAGGEIRPRRLLRGQIAFASSRGSDAPPLLVKAARRLEPLDAGLARETYLEALARTHLLYGEWLRRENRRIDARGQLRTAHEMFASMGAAGFAERAARELRATGERVRPRTTGTPVQLTARETQIGRLAGEGLSNPEIAAHLFMSPRTVEYHPHKVFAKLDINSRNQLHGVLANRGNDGPQPTA